MKSRAKNVATVWALLASREAKGRERYSRVNEAEIGAQLRPWVAKNEKYWDDRLSRLKDAAERADD